MSEKISNIQNSKEFKNLIDNFQESYKDFESHVEIYPHAQSGESYYVMNLVSTGPGTFTEGGCPHNFGAGIRLTEDFDLQECFKKLQDMLIPAVSNQIVGHYEDIKNKYGFDLSKKEDRPKCYEFFKNNYVKIKGESKELKSEFTEE
jgi:hypothetical protein